MSSWLVRSDCEVFVGVDALAWVGKDSWRVVGFCSGCVGFGTYGHQCFYLQLMRIFLDDIGQCTQCCVWVRRASL